MREFNSNHVNLAFEKEISLASEFLVKSPLSIDGYSANVVHDRLIQRLVEIGYKPFVCRAKELCNSSTVKFEHDSGGFLECGKGKLKIGSGEIIVSPLQWFLNQFDFIQHWFYSSFSIFNVNYRNDDEEDAVLVFGIGDETLFQDGSDKRFSDYCEYGQIKPLKTSKKIYIENANKKKSTNPQQIEYCKRPLIKYLQSAKLGILQRVSLFLNQLFILAEYMITSCVQPKITLIARDFAYCKIAQYLDDKDKLEAILLTCSNYTEQPLFTRELKNTTVHMVWYAQAWKPVVYASASVESDLPNLRWIRVDKHWVWTQSFSNYISELGISKSTEVVGPIVWCRPPQEISSKKEAKDKIRIVVFDASPFSDEVALCNGQLTNYHNPKNLHSFIQGLLELKSTLEKLLSISVELTVKTKRGYNHLYDKEYFDYLNKLELEEIIKLPHHSVNLYELIDQCDFVIAYPFTSPTYIADTLRVPSIYFDPTGDVVSHDFGDENSLIKYSSGFDNLLEAVKALLNVNESKASQSI